MRHLLCTFVALGVATAHASPRSFTLTWNEHMHSSKGTEKTVTTVYTVTGTKLHFESTYAGPDPDKPRNKPQKLDIVIKNDLVVDRALAAFDKIAITPTKPAADPAVDDQTGCVTRGKQTRCETARGEDTPTPGFKALTELTIALTENVPSPR